MAERTRGTTVRRAGMRRTVTASVVACVAAGGVGGWALWDRQGGDSADAAPPTTTPTRTAPVEQMDITSTIELTGTVRYRDERSITAVVPPGPRGEPVATGVVTDLAEAGEVLAAGDRLGAIDRQPVVVIDGDVPAYRDLREGVDDGPDVRQLEAFLVAGGFDPDGTLTVDEEFTAATADAVERWEESIGLAEPDGVVPRAQVVVLDGPAIVIAAHVDIGATVATGTPLVDLALTGSGRVVLADVALDDQDEVPPGTEVAVTVGDDTVAGRVTTVLPTARVAAGPAGEPTATVEVEVTGGLDTDLVEAPATIEVTATVVEGATVVPIAALVALASGGYGVRVVGDAGATLVEVTTGDYTDALVQVEGAGVIPGAEVVIP